MGMMFKNGIPYAGIPDEIDAATVGGHTVEVDVPADAAFTDTINSDVTAEGNPVILKELQGGVPFSEITVKGENISGQEMTLTTTGKNQLPITVTSGAGAGVTYTVDNDEITVSGTTTGVSTITISAPNMTITEDMRLSYRGNLSGMTPKATILRNGETVYPTPNDTTGSKLLAGDVLQNVYIQQQNADVAVSGSAKFQLEYGAEVTEYEKYSSETYTFTPDSADYVIPTDITQKENVNVLTIDAEDATLSVTGVRTNAAVAKLWYYITDVDNNGNISGYTAGEGIKISEDKIISINNKITTNEEIIGYLEDKPIYRKLIKLYTDTSLEDSLAADAYVEIAKDITIINYYGHAIRIAQSSASGTKVCLNSGDINISGSRVVETSKLIWKLHNQCLTSIRNIELIIEYLKD